MNQRAAAAAIGIVATMWAVTAHGDEVRRESPESDQVYSVPLGDSPRRGPAASRVTIVYACEYGSPFCERIRPTFDQLVADYGDDIAIVHKHMIVHPTARPASLAACAAHRQGKFWDMDALLWDKVWGAKDFSETRVKSLAGELGLDRRRFERDYSKTCPKIVDAEQAAMKRVGVSGVPASFINGRFLGGAQPVDAFKQLIDAERALASDRIENKNQVKGYYAKWVVKAGKKETPIKTAEHRPDQPPREPIQTAKPRRAEADPAQVYAVEIGDSPVSSGPASAKVTMVIAGEFGDPFCTRLLTTVSDLISKYGSDLRVVHKHFIVHPQRGTEPALTACAAHRQGKYAVMADAIWSSADRSRPALRDLASKLKLDLSQYDADLDTCKDVVAADIARMQELGVSGIPTAFINGRIIVGARENEDFEAVIDEELAKAKVRLGKRGRAKDYYQTWVIGKGKAKP